ncbi:hypothetical protein [Myroides sp. DF42-4-2]|nr:hypothetical protein [Myroides sp. DF42-4-2]
MVKVSKKGTYSKPDFMVIDRKRGNVVDLVDAKNGVYVPDIG